MRDRQLLYKQVIAGGQDKNGLPLEPLLKHDIVQRQKPHDGQLHQEDGSSANTFWKQEFGTKSTVKAIVNKVRAEKLIERSQDP